jgi:hypothetical protein
VKAISILGIMSMVAGATAGAIRAQIASGSRASALRPTSFVCKTSEVNNMEYVIAFGVAAMMGLYVLIIARCLREPEWQ